MARRTPPRTRRSATCRRQPPETSPSAILEVGQGRSGRPPRVVRVGLSHTTGEVTHHIAPDIDTERDHLMRVLEGTGDVAEAYVVNGFHRDREGRNGGGDPWHTNGNLSLAVIKPATVGSHP